MPNTTPAPIENESMLGTFWDAIEAQKDSASPFPKRSWHLRRISGAARYCSYGVVIRCFDAWQAWESWVAQPCERLYRDWQVDEADALAALKDS